MKHQKMNRILAAALSAACLVPFAAMVPVDADAADIMSALEITQEMGLGFNIGNSLDSTGYGNYDDITSFEKSYGNPAVTKEMVDTIKAKGFDSVRIPTSWFRHVTKTTDENGNPAGVDVDLAKESFGRLGYAVSFVGIDWEEKKKLVEHGDIDCIWGCFSVDGREDEYNWTEPYMISRQVVAVNRSSDIYRLSDLEGRTIAVQSTTKPESIFLERTDSRIPLVREVYSLEDRELLYTSLGKGYVDAIAAHETAIRQYMKDYDVDYRILDESILTTGIGVAFAKNDARGLNEQLSRVFEEMRADGTTRTIIGRYLSDPDKYLEVDCAAG